jgi:hypothetical protein
VIRVMKWYRNYVGEMSRVAREREATRSFGPDGCSPKPDGRPRHRRAERVRRTRVWGPSPSGCVVIGDHGHACPAVRPRAILSRQSVNAMISS